MSPEEDKVRPFIISPHPHLSCLPPTRRTHNPCSLHFPTSHLGSLALLTLFPRQACPSLYLELKEASVSSAHEQAEGAGPATSCSPLGLVKMQIPGPCPLRFCLSSSEVRESQVEEPLI